MDQTKFSTAEAIFNPTNQDSESNPLPPANTTFYPGCPKMFCLCSALLPQAEERIKYLMESVPDLREIDGVLPLKP